MISGAVFAGLISSQALLPYALEKWFGLNGNYALLFGGVVLIIALLQNPEGVIGTFSQADPQESRREGPAAAPAPAASHAREGARPASPSGAAVLPPSGLSVDFGGVHALARRNFEVGEGELVGLIGPNGAGKTTFVDAVTGFVGLQRRRVDARRARHRVAVVRAERAGATRARTHLAERRALRRPVREENLIVAQERSPSWGASRFARARPAGDRRDAGAVRTRLGPRRRTRRTSPTATASSSGARGAAFATTPTAGDAGLDEPAAGLEHPRERDPGIAPSLDRGRAGQATLLIDHDMSLVASASAIA